MDVYVVESFDYALDHATGQSRGVEAEGFTGEGRLYLHLLPLGDRELRSLSELDRTLNRRGPSHGRWWIVEGEEAYAHWPGLRAVRARAASGRPVPLREQLPDGASRSRTSRSNGTRASTAGVSRATTSAAKSARASATRSKTRGATTKAPSTSRASTPTANGARASTPAGQTTRASTPAAQTTRTKTPAGQTTRASTPTSKSARAATPTPASSRPGTGSTKTSRARSAKAKPVAATTIDSRRGTTRPASAPTKSSATGGGAASKN